MNFHALDLLVIGLATWRISKILVDEEGPFKVFHHLRIFISKGLPTGNQFIETLWGLFSCVWCMSVWVGFLLALTWYYLWYHPLAKIAIYGFAFSAVAIVVDSVVTRMYYISE